MCPSTHLTALARRYAPPNRVTPHVRIRPHQLPHNVQDRQTKASASWQPRLYREPSGSRSTTPRERAGVTEPKAKPWGATGADLLQREAEVAGAVLDALRLVLVELEVVIRKRSVDGLPGRLGSDHLTRREPRGGLQDTGDNFVSCSTVQIAERALKWALWVGQNVAVRRRHHTGSSSRRLRASRLGKRARRPRHGSDKA
jgi:hypothetical protein